MKSQSWYEPEPDRTRSPASPVAARSTNRASGIVVTDLDSSDDEDGGEVEAELISPALMERIRTQSLRSGIIEIPTGVADNSQALVLYRPIPLPDAETDTEDNVEEEEMSISEPMQEDPDAMDIDD